MFEPQKLTLTPGSDADLRLRRFLRERVTGIRTGLHEIHTDKLIKWRKAYEAVPAESTREIPWHGASNLVVPVIAIHADTLLARVMSAVLKVRPLWVSRLLGMWPEDEGKGVREGLEEYMQYVGLEPTELDLYRIYHEWFGEAIRLGTSVIKTPWDKVIEDQMVPAGDGTGRFEWTRKTLYEGPRPEKIAFQDFGIPPTAKTIEQADFKYHVIHLSKLQLQERAYRKVYDSGIVDRVLMVPDRTSPDFVTQQTESDSGAHTHTANGWQEWDVYECHFKYRLDETHFCRVMVWYHEKSNQLLRCYYNYYPDEVFTAARLFYRDNAFHGYGFAETLGMLQEEISVMHNQRRDNMLVANTMMWRVSPDSKLHKGFKIFPSAMVPADEKEIEGMSPGQVSPMTIDEERLSLELAEKRSGVSPPMQGAGAGTNTKRGVYTAMGTLSLLQEGNTRTDLNITDIRYAHTKVGRLVANLYAYMGLDCEYHQNRVKMFGQMAEGIVKAFDAIREGKMALPIYAATSSVNREVEKQNDLMLSGLMMKHHETIANMMQQASSMMMPPEVKQYLVDAVKSATIMMREVMRHFGYDEVERLVPEPKSPSAPPPQLGGGNPAAGAGGQQPPQGPPSPGGQQTPQPLMQPPMPPEVPIQ